MKLSDIKLRNPVEEGVTNPREFDFNLCIYKISGEYLRAKSEMKKKDILSSIGVEVKNMTSKQFELLDDFLQGLMANAKLTVKSLNDLVDNHYIPCEHCKIEDYCKGFKSY